MRRPLQALVDDLADELDRTVTIDDARWKMAAYSRLHGDIDDFRLEAILQRELSPEGKAWTNGLGLSKSRGPVRIAANVALRAEARIVVPIRHRDNVLGYMTLMDPEETLTTAQIVVIEEHASRAGELMHQEQLANDDVRAHGETLLKGLLSDDFEERRQAAARVTEGSFLSPRDAAGVLVAQFTDPASVPEEALEQYLGARKPRGREWTIGGIRASQLVLIAFVDGDKAFRAIGERLTNSLQRTYGSAVSIGTSGREHDLTNLIPHWLRAQRAATAAAFVAAFDGKVDYRDLGAYAPALSVMADDVADFSGLLRPLVAQDGHASLVATAETYLDLAGDVKATAEALHLHRAGVYYRLQRILALTGMDLVHNGEHRLLVHLAVKAWRLQPTRSDSAGIVDDHHSRV